MGLAATLIVGSVFFLRVDVPYVAFGLFLFGCCLLSWVIWSATSQWRRVFRAPTAIVALVILVFVAFKVFPSRKANVPEQPEVKEPTTTPPVDHRPVEPSKRPTSQEVTVVLYDDVNDPQFLVDGRPASPARYSSGIATLHLPAGTHIVPAEYSTRTCSATITVPFRGTGPVPASCSLKKVGGS